MHASACREVGIRHLPTQSYRPQTNGKAERFIQTMLREWAYGRIYGSSAERSSQLAQSLQPTAESMATSAIARLIELQGNNLLGNYS